MADANRWIQQFLMKRENKYFCAIDRKFLLDKFNYFELDQKVRNYAEAVKLINDEHDADPKYQEDAVLLYGLLHQRFIIETRGMLRMVPKFSKKEFGYCPRAFCQEHPVLPCGLSDDLNQDYVRLYCGNCEDVYLPPREWFKKIDGAFFGTSFPHLFFLNVPKLLIKGDNVEEKDKELVAELSKKYVPKVYGYRLHKLWHSVSLQGLDEHSHDKKVYGDQNEEETKGQDDDEIEALKQRVQEQDAEIKRLREEIESKENDGDEKEGHNEGKGGHGDKNGNSTKTDLVQTDLSVSSCLSEMKHLKNRMKVICDQFEGSHIEKIQNGMADDDIKGLKEEMQRFGKWIEALNGNQNINGVEPGVVVETEGK